MASHQVVNGGAHDYKKYGLCELNLFSPVVESDEEDVFQRYYLVFSFILSRSIFIS